MNCTELVLELFSPDQNGYSRWVSKSECIGKYKKLEPRNGNHWYRNIGLKKYIFEKEIRDGETYWRFNGLICDDDSTRTIRKDIKDFIKKEKCVLTNSVSTKNNPIEVDHKNGRYNDLRVLNESTQLISDFQPLLKFLNAKKREDCIVCKKTNKRFDAKNLGFGVSFTHGNEDYVGSCEGCFWFDVKDFKSKLVLIK
jgi:hypothetical protein